MPPGQLLANRINQYKTVTWKKQVLKKLTKTMIENV